MAHPVDFKLASHHSVSQFLKIDLSLPLSLSFSIYIYGVWIDMYPIGSVTLENSNTLSEILVSLIPHLDLKYLYPEDLV